MKMRSICCFYWVYSSSGTNSMCVKAEMVSNRSKGSCAVLFKRLTSEAM